MVTSFRHEAGGWRLNSKVPSGGMGTDRHVVVRAGIAGGRGNAKISMRSHISVLAAALLMAAEEGADNQVERPLSAESAGRSAVQVALIPVLLPLAGDDDQRVMAAAEKAIQQMAQEDRRGVVIFEFRGVMAFRSATLASNVH